MRSLETEIASARDNADRRKHDIKMKITSKIDPLNKETALMMEELLLDKYLDINQDFDAMFELVNKNEERMQHLNLKKQKIQDYQKTLDMGEIVKFENVETALQTQKYRKMLWHSIRNWTSKVAQWETENFDNIDVDLISLEAERYTKTVIQCERELPTDSSALIFLKQRVTEFKDTMPIVRALGNRNLKEEHWLEIKQLLNLMDFPIEERQFTLKELMEKQVFGKQEEVENISITATQEAKLTT